MVVIPEVHLSGKVPDPAGETEIIRQLVELGFNVVDQQQIAMIREQEMVTNAINDPMAAASLGVEFGADVIIVGEAFSEFAGRNNNMISCRARVEARAIHTRTGRILATDGHHGSGMDISENLAGKSALKNAGSTLGNYLISQLCEKYDESSPVTTTSAIEIMASNVDFMSLKKLTDHLTSVRGVSNVQKSMTGNVGRINLQYSGGIDKLAEEILSKSSLGFDITGFSDNKLEMAAK
jgi:hypothetical protein